MLSKRPEDKRTLNEGERWRKREVDPIRQNEKGRGRFSRSSPEEMGRSRPAGYSRKLLHLLLLLLFLQNRPRGAGRAQWV